MKKFIVGLLLAALLVASNAFAFNGTIFINSPTAVSVNGVRQLQQSVMWLLNDPNNTDGFFIDTRPLGQTAASLMNDLKQKCAAAAAAAGVAGVQANDFIVQGGWQ